MTAVDWVALGLVLLAALGGAVQGFVWSGLSLAGLLAGAFLGGRLVPVLLANGTSSPYAPVVALVAAIALAVAFEVLGSTVGARIRSRERARSVRALDSAGGVVAGALIGFAIVWVLGAMALQSCSACVQQTINEITYNIQNSDNMSPQSRSHASSLEHRRRSIATGAAAAVLDSAGASWPACGFAIVWVLGAMALQLPGQADLRRAVQRSYVLQQLNEIVPPRSLLNALARIDPFPSFAGPPLPTEPPDPRVLAQARRARGGAERRARARHGLRARRRGQRLGRGQRARRHRGARRRGRGGHRGRAARAAARCAAQAVAFDPHNDVAVLRVDGLEAPPLRAEGAARRAPRSRSSATR